MSTVEATQGNSRRRYLWLLGVFLLGVLVGWLLSPRCKTCGGSVPSAAAGGGAKTSGDSEEAKRQSGKPKNGKGDTPLGPDSGPAPPGDKAVGNAPTPADTPSPPADQILKHLDGNGRDAVGVPDPPPGQILKAADFRYDRTGLPRYAQSVSTTASTLSHADGSSAYHSTAAILTTSRFEDVVDWYKAQLPAGWSVQVVGDVGALAQQVSINNILNTLTAATQNKGAGAEPTKPPAPAGVATGTPQGIAMFSPPQGATGDPSVLIQQGQGQQIEITLSKDGVDP